MSRGRETDRRLRALIVVICVIIPLLMMVAAGVLAWQTHKSDLRIDSADAESG